MNKIAILMKNEITIYVNRIKNTSKGKRVGSGIVLLLCLALFVVSIVFSGYSTLKAVAGSGIERFVIDQQIVFLFLFSLLFTITSGMASNEKDSEFLLSLPVKKADIIISKTLFKYLFDFILSFVLLVPICVVYFALIERAISIIIFGLTVSLLLPLIFVGLEYLINSFTNGIAIKFKYYNLIKTIISVIEIIAFLAVYLSISEVTVENLEQAPRFFLFSSIADVIIDGNLLNLLILFVSSLAISLLGVWSFSFLYGKKRKTYKNKDNILRKSGSTSVYFSLIKKEFKTYFNSSAWLMNTSIGFLILMFAPIGLFFIDIEGEMLQLIAYFICAFSLSTCSIACSSLSLEGKNFWILKVAPISGKKVVYAKALMNFILIAISASVSFVIILFSNKFTFIFSLLLYLLILATGLVVSFVGIITNLLFPKLDFENEMAVVKRSASVGLSMLLFMIVFLIFPALFFFLTLKGMVIKLSIFMLINIVFLLLVFALSVLFIEKKSEKIILKL